MNEKRSLPRIIRRTLLLLVALGIVVLIFVQNRQERKPQLPIYGAVPEFSLVAEDGRAVTRSDWFGKVAVVDFIFTYCAGTCPIMSTQMSKLQSVFAGSDAVRFVSITVDPERDTPEVLQEYAKQYDAKLHQWMFLTGEKSVIYQLSRNGFRLGVAEEEGSEEEPIIHSLKFVLLDRQSRIRGYYDGTEDESVQQLIVDMRTLLDE